MADKHQLRIQRAETIINLTAKRQESELGLALKATTVELLERFDLDLVHRKDWPNSEIVGRLAADHPDVDFYTPTPRTHMKPDGGFLSLRGENGVEYPVLISEVKNQGTNDLRAAEGLAPQSKGNAIERLGKNVIGIRAAMLGEGIVPFVCFGYGIDFADGSTILDRVATIAMYGPLNQVNVVNGGADGRFNRGSFFFRAERWTEEEMTAVMTEIGTRAIHYYLANYGEGYFQAVPPAPR